MRDRRSGCIFMAMIATLCALSVSAHGQPADDAQAVKRLRSSFTLLTADAMAVSGPKMSSGPSMKPT